MNKLAKLKYLPNNFEIIDEGDHVVVQSQERKFYRKIKLLEC